MLIYIKTELLCEVKQFTEINMKCLKDEKVAKNGKII